MRAGEQRSSTPSPPTHSTVQSYVKNSVKYHHHHHHHHHHHYYYYYYYYYYY
jgi:hypothetical protein